MHEGRERRRRKKRSSRSRIFQLICLIVAIGVGVLIIGKKVSADTPARGMSAPGDAPKAGDPAAPKPKPKAKPKDAGVDAAPAVAAPPPAPDPKDAGVDAAFDPDAGGLDYAVELRDPKLLVPRYFEVLAAHGATHVFNLWTRMPTVGEQLAMPGALREGTRVVVRLMVPPKKKYEVLKREWAPFDRIREPDHTMRADVATSPSRPKGITQ